MLKFRRYEPAPALSGFVHGYWQVQAGSEPEVLDLIPDGHPELSVFLQPDASFVIDGKRKTIPQTAFFGQLSKRTILLLQPGHQVINIKLYPWVPYLLFGVPCYELLDDITDINALSNDASFRQVLRDIASASNPTEVTCLLDQYFLQKLDRLPPSSPFVNFAVQQIFKSGGTIGMDAIIAKIQASRRYLEKVFKNHIGMPPKQYARLIRVKKASLNLLDANYGGSISCIAANMGYYDPSHFLKDFKAVAQRTPSAFINAKGNLPFDQLEPYLQQWDYS